MGNLMGLSLCVISVHLAVDEKLKLFNYLAYFCYYLWAPLHFWHYSWAILYYFN